ncbi:hypothetical protein CCC_04033 [Paramagnetospirillum magnetotacticum MS-1]|uniref:Methyltransferase type 11 domain-containing protein n=2 Tax=Paramagnetospirillum magnetotacticum TaxID=188 RepID=A0A0C2UDE1_PARME|nr:hypothetical protein CCC_04033 [Paramagnetospirillum magnetotacticum MS-1]
MHAVRGEYETALSLLRQLHAFIPDDIQVMRALGIVLANSGDHEAALPFLHQVAQRQCTPDNVMGLIKVLGAMRRFPDIDHVCSVVWPHIGDELAFLGEWGYANLLMERFDRALEILGKALALDPHFRPALHNGASALVRSGRGEEAVSMYSRLGRAWASTEAVARDFVGEYAALSQSYDDNPLHHYFSARLVRLVQDARPEAMPDSVLELGCGSGLLSQALPQKPDRLVGIDISPDMLARARTRGAYSSLLCGDLVEVMAGLEEPFDAVMSAGVLCYLPDLRKVFANVARLLSPGGVFAFSVDPVGDDMEIAEMEPGEFAHSRPYLRALAAETGLTEIRIDIDLHRGAPGFWCSFGKAG